MATSTIKPKKGTTEEWRESARILEVNEWGVEETASGRYILRIGDGKNVFLDLPPVVDTEDLATLAQTIKNFTANMQSAASAANTAAQQATAATTAAQSAASACQNIAAGINSMSDKTTGKTYTIGVEAGIIYLEEE